MITLYNVPVSSYGAKVRIILAHKGIEWTELAPPDDYGSPAYRAVIPSGTVPAIIDGDLKLADSEAIAEYLDERVPSPLMMPADPVARARAREGRSPRRRAGAWAAADLAAKQTHRGLSQPPGDL